MSEGEEAVSKLIGQIENRALKTRAVDETPIGITIADMREEDNPLIYVNEAFERITGYTEAETIGRNCRFLQGPETEPEPVARMREAIELTNMARDVADVMLESGADYQPVALNEVLQDEIQETRSSFPEATVSASGALPAVRVQANDLLGSLFRNLLTNAIHHNKTGKPEVVVSATVDDGDIAVMVADNGPGVSETGHSHLFEKGWTSTESDGTGIGLYIVSRLVDDYGGEISLLEDGDPVGPEMDLGGATFVVRLPVIE